MAMFRFALVSLGAAALPQLPAEDAVLQHASCDMNISLQAEGFLHEWCSGATSKERFPACYPNGVPDWHRESNVIVRLPDPNSCAVAVSEEWVISGWSWKYVQLAPGQSFSLNVSDSEQAFLKLIRGTVLDVNQIGVQNAEGHWETFVVTPPNTERSLQLDHRLKSIKAGSEGAVFALMVVPVELFNVPITAMDAAPTTTISGPFSEHFQWTKFANYFPEAFPDSLEFWNLAGILLQDHHGDRLNYNQWWTQKQTDDTDGGYHNHAGTPRNGTFGELHMVMYSAAPNTGMIVQLPHTVYTETVHAPKEIPADKKFFWNNRDNDYVQLTLPLPPGYVHGPLWSINVTDGEPTRDCMGAVRYPWHGLVTGPISATPGSSSHPARYTLWVVFEHAPEVITVPTPMLQYVTNAYLQNVVDWPTKACAAREVESDLGEDHRDSSHSVGATFHVFVALVALVAFMK
ncbi:unnamed protein product [Durusdinium trenchii]|uniref:Aldos-2-ulose dehydratase/isomerase (AUDH) Cupin domain-containing protein n=1 Tax=Durusdinium trenchii TaxID=1381693 RepID=A0ABP0PRP0_9DINO